MRNRKHFSLLMSESLLADSEAARRARGLNFSEYTRTSIHLVATMKHMDIRRSARLVTADGNILFPRLKQEKEPLTVRKDITLDEQSVEHALTEVEQGTLMSERIRRSLRLANFIVAHTAAPYTCAEVDYQEHNYTFIW